MIRARLLLAVACAAATTAVARDGALDEAFAVRGRHEVVPDGETARTYAFNAIQAVPEGALIAAGFMDRSPPVRLSEPDFRIIVARLQADGSPMPGWGNDDVHRGLLVMDDLVVNARMESATSIATLDDGGFLVGGTFDDGGKGGFVLRFDAGGKLDEAFAQGGVLMLPFGVLDLAVDSRRRVLAVGQAVRSDAPTNRGIVARLDLATGALDARFGHDGVVELLQYGSDGSPLDHPGLLEAIAIDARDAVYVGGSQHEWSPEQGHAYVFSLAKLVGDGDFDADFAQGGWLRFRPQGIDSSLAFLSDLVIDADRLLLSGSYQNAAGDIVPTIGRLTLQGRPDAGFGDRDSPGFARPDPMPGFAYRHVPDIALQDDGRIVLGLLLDDPEQQGKFAVMRLTAEGSTDPTFGDAGVALVSSPAPSIFGNTHAVALQSGRVVAAGIDGHRGDDERLLIRATVLRLSSSDVFRNGFEGE